MSNATAIIRPKGVINIPFEELRNAGNAMHAALLVAEHAASRNCPIEFTMQNPQFLAYKEGYVFTEWNSSKTQSLVIQWERVKC